MTHFLNRYYRLILVGILAFTFFTRIYSLHLPEAYVFDEVYHAVTAKLIARDDPWAYEWWNPPVEPNTAVDWLHPPYAKYTQAISLLVFGENSFGWRFSSVIFGVLLTAAVFKAADLAFKSKPLALTAALLTSLDGLILVQSRVAMNDIHVTFFIVLTVICYQLYRQRNRSIRWLVATGLSAGFAVGSKWSGVFIVGLLGLWEALDIGYHVWVQLRTSKIKYWAVLQRLGVTFLALVVIPVLMYLVAYGHMFLQGKDLDHLYRLHQQIWWYQTSLSATHGYQSRPWQWFFNLRPVWYHVTYATPGMIANIYAFGNPILSWAGVGAVAASIASLGVSIRKSKWKLAKVSPKTFSLLLILCSYLIVWVPWQASPRIMFYYHYTPAVPFMAILVAYWLHIAWRKNYQGGVLLMLGLIAAAFVLWYPHWTNLEVPATFANRVYFALSSWK